MNWQIRRPTAADLPQIHEIFSQTVKNNFREEGILDTLAAEAEQEIQALKNTLATDFATQGEQEYFLVAHSENQIVGTIAYGKVNRLISNNISLRGEEIPEVKSVYVLPDFQNQGIGSLLFQHILLVLTEKHIPDFYLDSGYRRAQIYWEKKLGTPSHILKDHWGEGHDHKIWYRRVEAFAF